MTAPPHDDGAGIEVEMRIRTEIGTATANENETETETERAAHDPDLVLPPYDHRQARIRTTWRNGSAKKSRRGKRKLRPTWRLRRTLGPKVYRFPDLKRRRVVVRDLLICVDVGKRKILTDICLEAEMSGERVDLVAVIGTEIEIGTGTANEIGTETGNGIASAARRIETVRGIRIGTWSEKGIEIETGIAIETENAANEKEETVTGIENGTESGIGRGTRGTDGIVACLPDVNDAIELGVVAEAEVADIFVNEGRLCKTRYPLGALC